MYREQTRYEEYDALRCKTGYRVINSNQDNSRKCIRKLLTVVELVFKSLIKSEPFSMINISDWYFNLGRKQTLTFTLNNIENYQKQIFFS